MDLATNPELAALATPIKPNSKHNNSSKTPPAAKTIFSIMVISAPLLYVSLLHVSPSSLFNDTKFWFLMSNAIILVVAADSGMFDAAAAATSSPDGHADMYEEYVKHNTWRTCRSITYAVQQTPPVQTKEEEPTTVLALVPVEGAGAGRVEDSSKVMRYSRRRSLSAVKAPRNQGTKCNNKVVLRRSTTEKLKRGRVPEESGSEYSAMSDEELNRRVEEFIRKFNMEIRRQEVGNEQD